MKDIYKHFNNIDFNVEDINLTNAEIDDITKKRLKNNLRNSIKPQKPKKIFKISVAVFIASFIALFSIGFLSSSFTAFADDIPVLNSLFEKFNTSYGGNFKDYTQVINKSQKDKGFEVTINEVAMDDFSFKLIYTIKTDKKISEIKKSPSFPHTMGKTISLNNKGFLCGPKSTYEIIDDYTIRSIDDYDIYKQNIPKNFNIKIKFNKINAIEGNWNFEFNSSKEKISTSTKTFSFNKKIHTYNFDNKKIVFTIKKVSFSPIATTIYSRSFNCFDFSRLKLKDEKGNPIEIIAGSNITEGFLYQGVYKSRPMKEIPEKIIIENENNEFLEELILK